MGAFLTLQTVTCQTKSAMIHANLAGAHPFTLASVMLTTTQPPTISQVPISLANEIPVRIVTAVAYLLSFFPNPSFSNTRR